MKNTVFTCVLPDLNIAKIETTTAAAELIYSGHWERFKSVWRQMLFRFTSES